MLEHYCSLADLPSHIPVFPLRGAILLPRTMIPLNIFEPRYLAMLDDVLAGNRLIGLIQPQNGPDLDDDTESPLDPRWPLRDTGCIGRITAFSEQDDGSVLITLTGIARFNITSEQETDKPYRTCSITSASFKQDLEEDHDEDQVDRHRLLKLLRIYLDANDMTADWDSIHASSTDYLVNTLCLHSPYGPEEKQALLEARNLKARAEILMALAEMELASKNEGGGTLQ